jgi:hypothetical protein
VARVVAGETPIKTGDGAKLIFHALPLPSLDVWPAFLKIAETPSQIPNLLVPPGGNPNDWRYNLDGFVAHTTRRDVNTQTYVQLFRDEGIEGVGGVLYFDESRAGFYGLAVERAAISVLTTIQRLWKLLGVTGPIVLGLALSGVKGWKMAIAPTAKGLALGVAATGTNCKPARLGRRGLMEQDGPTTAGAARVGLSDGGHARSHAQAGAPGCVSVRLRAPRKRKPPGKSSTSRAAYGAEGVEHTPAPDASLSEIR